MSILWSTVVSPRTTYLIDCCVPTFAVDININLRHQLQIYCTMRSTDGGLHPSTHIVIVVV
jgi:hypothetical protein